MVANMKRLKFKLKPIIDKEPQKYKGPPLKGRKAKNVGKG